MQWQSEILINLIESQLRPVCVCVHVRSVLFCFVFYFDTLRDISLSSYLVFVLSLFKRTTTIAKKQTIF